MLKITDLQGQRDKLNKKIDRDAQTEEQIPKAIKQTQKALETQTLDARRERELLGRIKFIKASVEYIQERQVIDGKLKELNS